MAYYAHIRQEETGNQIYQTVTEHLTGTAALCREFADAFGAGAEGELAGLTHDRGKCTEGFQNRLLHGGPIVSAARGKMAVRELIVFKHDTELGCAPAHKLFELVRAERKEGVTAPRSYEDYTVTVDEASLPSGVICTRMG